MRPLVGGNAAITERTPREWELSGTWTFRRLASVAQELQQRACPTGEIVLEGSRLEAIDSAGVWLLRRWLSNNGALARLEKWPPPLRKLMTTVVDDSEHSVLKPPARHLLERVGRAAYAATRQASEFLKFVGLSALVQLRLFAHPSRIRWRTVLYNLQHSGFDALPIVGLTSFMLGIVVAYQGAAQLKHYGASIFVVDLVGFAMLREFAPLITAIIIAGRSGSGYAAQIGTMVVTEEIDAMRTVDIDPIELLVLPKILALALALPLLTVFSDLTGVLGGMVMARSQLGIGFHEFVDRFGRDIRGPALLLGVGKAVVFGVIIALIGCFQGFRARGSADAVGRQTTLSVVQSIVLVLGADGLFSVTFSLLGL